MSDQTIEQRLDILLRRYRKAITLEEGDAFYQEELIASIENDFVQLLNEARLDELNGMSGCPRFLMESTINDRIAQLTPKEDK